MKRLYLFILFPLAVSSLVMGSVRNGPIEFVNQCSDALGSSFHSFEVESGPFELRRLLDEMISFRKADFVANLQEMYPIQDQTSEVGKLVRFEKKFIAVAPKNPFARYNEREGSGALPYAPTQAFYLRLLEEVSDQEKGSHNSLFEMSIPDQYFHHSEEMRGKVLRFWWIQKNGVAQMVPLTKQISGNSRHLQPLEMISLGGLYERFGDIPYWKQIFKKIIFKEDSDNKNYTLVGAMPAYDETTVKRTSSQLMWLFVGEYLDKYRANEQWYRRDVHYAFLYDAHNRQLQSFYEFPNTIDIIVPKMHRGISSNGSTMASDILAFNYKKGSIEAYRVVDGRMTLVHSLAISTVESSGESDIVLSELHADYLGDGQVALEFRGSISNRPGSQNFSRLFIYGKNGLVPVGRSWRENALGSFDRSVHFHFLSPDGTYGLTQKLRFRNGKVRSNTITLWLIEQNNVNTVGSVMYPPDERWANDWSANEYSVVWLSTYRIRFVVKSRRSDAEPIFYELEFDSKTKSRSDVNSRFTYGKDGTRSLSRLCKVEFPFGAYSKIGWTLGKVLSRIRAEEKEDYFFETGTDPSGTTKCGYSQIQIQRFTQTTEFTALPQDSLFVATVLPENSAPEEYEPKPVPEYRGGNVVILVASDATIVPRETL